MRLASRRPETSGLLFRSMPDTFPAMTDSIPLKRLSVRHRIGTASVMSRRTHRDRAGEPQSVIDRGAASAKVFPPPLVREEGRR